MRPRESSMPFASHRGEGASLKYSEEREGLLMSKHVVMKGKLYRTITINLHRLSNMPYWLSHYATFLFTFGRFVNSEICNNVCEISFYVLPFVILTTICRTYRVHHYYHLSLNCLTKNFWPPIQSV